MKKAASSAISHAVILAAGESSRFVPFHARGTHKSTFRLMGNMIIEDTLRELADERIKKAIIVKRPEDVQIPTISQSIRKKIRIEFVDQDEPLGMGDAILRAAEHVGERFLVVNPQQVNICEHLSVLRKQKYLRDFRGPILFSQSTTTPQKYGMLKLDENRVIGVVEKPTNIKGLSDQRILGIYILTKDFVNFMRKVKRSHYQLEHALSAYAKKHHVAVVQSDHQSLSLKYIWDVFDIAAYKFSVSKKKQYIHKKASIHLTAIIKGPVIIEDSARVCEYAILDGPCYIGKNALVGSYCKVRSESVLEEDVELQNNVEVKHSLIGKGTHIHSGYLGDSILGENVRIGAGFITANKRFDRKIVRIPIQGRMIESGRNSFGALIGDGAHIGIHSGTNPGTIIASQEIIPPMTMVSNKRISLDK